MCMVSNIGDKWKQGWPDNPLNPWPNGLLPNSAISRSEFDALKQEIEELKKLLRAAKLYDDATGQPECQMDEKVDLIKKLAKIVGVDLDEVFGQHSK